MFNMNLPAPKPKKIIITGAAQGIGRAIARHLAQLGHHLYLIDINKEELAYTAEKHIPHFIDTGHPESVPTEIFQTPGHMSCDLRNHTALRGAIKLAAEHFGSRIDVLVNNAAMARPNWTDGRTIEDESVLTDWTAYMETNLTGAFVASQAALPFMKAKKRTSDERRNGGQKKEYPFADRNLMVGGACIINISSIHALQTDPNCEGYAASKAGLIGLTQAMAVSGRQWGIRCNVIIPGLIERSHETSVADEAGKRWAENVDKARHQKHPAGRVGCGEDIARTVEWLMDAGFTTGQQIVVDGGATKALFEGASDEY